MNCLGMILKVRVMKVNICGIMHKVIECEDNFDIDTHFGQIDFRKAIIKINKDLDDQVKKESICHEILHGILVHLGYDDLSGDEKFVNAVSNGICQAVSIIDMEEGVDE